MHMTSLVFFFFLFGLTHVCDSRRKQKPEAKTQPEMQPTRKIGKKKKKEMNPATVYNSLGIPYGLLLLSFDFIRILFLR